MIKKLITYFWHVRFEFGKYFVIGLTGVILDLITLIFFKEVFGIWPTLAVILNQIILVAYNFYLNKHWTFKNRSLPHKQFTRYMILFAFNYLLAVTTMYLFSDKFGFDYRMVRVATIALAVSWNFFLYKYWVYRS